MSLFSLIWQNAFKEGVPNRGPLKLPMKYVSSAPHVGPLPRRMPLASPVTGTFGFMAAEAPPAPACRTRSRGASPAPAKRALSPSTYSFSRQQV